MAPSAALDRAVRRVELFASTALLALTVLVFASVTLRYLFRAPLKDQFDLSRMLLGVAVFWAIAAACGADEYVRGDILWERLGPRLRKAIDLFGRAVIVLAMAVLAWQVLFKFQDVRRSGELTSELRWVIWPFYGVMFCGSALALLATAARLLRVALTPSSEVLASSGSSVVERAVAEGSA